MRTITRITEITVEKSERLVISKPHILVFAWCAACAAEVWMLTPEEAARIARISTRTIYRWVEAGGQVHFSETDADELFICLESLLIRKDV